MNLPCAFITRPLACAARDPCHAHASATVFTPMCAAGSCSFADAEAAEADA
jgi:hypothetical protein